MWAYPDPFKTTTHPRIFACIRAHWHSIKPILQQGIRFISKCNDELPANSDPRISLMYILRYFTRHFEAVIKTPEGKESDIRVTNAIFPYVDQHSDIIENNEQQPV